MAYRKRTLSAATVATAMDDLERARSACVRICTEAPIGGEHYRAAGEVMSAIDGFAEVVTGRRDHFHTKPCSPPGWAGES